MWSLYTMEYGSAIRKDEYPSFALTWMELEVMMLSEVSSLIREGQSSHGFTYTWNIRKNERDHKGRRGTEWGKRREEDKP